jgi:hypothetical protein
LRKAYIAFVKVAGRQYELPNTPKNAAVVKILNAAARLLRWEDRYNCLLAQVAPQSKGGNRG